jgi:hypothetical protein
VTALAWSDADASPQAEGRPSLFLTGGQDGYLRAWDGRSERPVAEVAVHVASNGAGESSSSFYRVKKQLCLRMIIFPRGFLERLRKSEVTEKPVYVTGKGKGGLYQGSSFTDVRRLGGFLSERGRLLHREPICECDEGVAQVVGLS